MANLIFAWFQLVYIKIMNEAQDGGYAVFIRLKKSKEYIEINLNYHSLDHVTIQIKSQ